MGDRHPRRPRPLRHRRHRQPAAGGPANNIDELQALCDQFRWHYNHQRPHQSLGKQVPAEAYQALPKVGPGDPRPRRRKTDPRVLLVSPTGSVHYRKRKIGIGIQWKGQQVTVIDSKPDHVVVLDRTTGSRPARTNPRPVGTYHRNGRKRDRPRKNPETTPPQVFLRTVSRAPRSRRSTAN